MLHDPETGKDPGNDILAPDVGSGDQEQRDDLRDDDRGDPDDLDDPEDELYDLSSTPPARHGIPTSRFPTFPTTFSVKPSGWFRKFKDLLFPPPSLDPEYIPNFRYTPIVSGVVIPFSILLEIPGLTENWYIRTEGNQPVEMKKNSAILEAGLAISIASAVIANVALVIRFLERRVKTMTLICIVFLSIHDLINIIAVTTFGIEHRHDDGFTYGEAFWMTMCSTIASTFTNITLIVDYIRTPDFAKSGSGLTRKQRSLVIVTIVLLSYIALGALVNGFLINLRFIDGLYFTVCSIETIGFGDIVPLTTGARVWVCIYSTIGIINLGLAVTMTRETVLEGIEVDYRKRVKRVREHRREVRHHRKIEARWRAAVERHLQDAGKVVWVPDVKHRNRPLLSFWRRYATRELQEGVRGARREGGRGHRVMRLNLEALTAVDMEMCAAEAGAPLETLLPPEYFLKRKPSRESRTLEPREGARKKSTGGVQARTGQMAGLLTRFALAISGHDGPIMNGPGPGPVVLAHGGLSTSENSSNKSPVVKGNTHETDVPADQQMQKQNSNFSSHSQKKYKSLSEEFGSFREGLANEEKRAFYARLLVACTLFLVFWMVGSAIFMATESWTYGIAMYFCLIAFTTIGYGDYSPETPAGRSVFVVWALLGVGTMTILISIISEAYSSSYKNALHAGAFDRAVARYRQRTRESALAKQQQDVPPFASAHDRISSHHSEASPVQDPAPTRAHAHAQKQLESLPLLVLGHARKFHEHMQFIIGGAKVGWDAKEVPEGLGQLLDDITGAGRAGGSEKEWTRAGGSGSVVERLRTEVLQDEEARRTLFALSIERCLKQIMDLAEETLEAVVERDKLACGADDSGSVDVDIGVNIDVHPHHEKTSNSKSDPPQSHRTSSTQPAPES